MNSICLISDGVLLSDAGGAFGLVPRSKWQRILKADDQNRVPQFLWTPVLRVDGKTILVDCGIGDKFTSRFDVQLPRESQLDQLMSIGLKPTDIDLVVLTHLHGDHAGWCTRESKPMPGSGADGIVKQFQPTYPNARYFVQRQEFEDATHPNERTRNTYFVENYVPLMEAGVLTLLEGDTQLCEFVRVVATPGHTVGHQSVIVSGVAFGPDEPPVFILGELATYMVHFARLPWVTAYDVLPLHTLETKRSWQAWALENRATLICSHEPDIPVGVLQHEGGFVNVVDCKRSYIVSPTVRPIAEK